jgi:5-formyltetrahydrofolate cyclo-ligase
MLARSPLYYDREVIYNDPVWEIAAPRDECIAMPDLHEQALLEKKELRRRMISLRENQKDADGLSRRIWDRIMALPEFVRCRTVMTYLDIGGEVRTRFCVPELWRLQKRVVIPYCAADDLRLFELKSMDELCPGMWQILEPKPQWRERLDRRVAPAEVDLVIVPGAAFDRKGNRLGWGKGYYDRFLRSVRPDAVKIAPAYENQLAEQIPTLPHDVGLDMIVTELAVYHAQ